MSLGRVVRTPSRHVTTYCLSSKWFLLWKDYSCNICRQSEVKRLSYATVPAGCFKVCTQTLNCDFCWQAVISMVSISSWAMLLLKSKRRMVTLWTMIFRLHWHFILLFCWGRQLVELVRHSTIEKCRNAWESPYRLYRLFARDLTSWILLLQIRPARSLGWH